MEQFSAAEVRSASYGLKPVGIRPETVEFGGGGSRGEFQVAMMAGGAPPPPPPLTAGSSFTALLELPPNQAMKLLHSASASAGESPPSNAPSGHCYNPDGHDHHHPSLMMNCTAAAAPAFPSDTSLIERAAKFSVFAASGCEWKDSPAGSPMGSNTGGGAGLKVKPEPADSGSNPNSTAKMSDPMAAAAGSPDEKCSKRKERDRKGKGSSKKNKGSGNENDDGKELPYVHVRARRGQATDSHSLAERARREKINARMKLLQELVPGCNKISGTALVLDEIINHVQSLQRQVEYLSMRLAAVNPRIDFNIDSFLAANGSLMESNFSSTVMPPSQWPEYQTSGERSQWQLGAPTQPVWAREEEHCNFITPESSLLSYDSSGNSASLHSRHLKMEL